MRTPDLQGLLTDGDTQMGLTALAPRIEYKKDVYAASFGERNQSIISVGPLS